MRELVTEEKIEDQHKPNMRSCHLKTSIDNHDPLTQLAIRYGNTEEIGYSGYIVA